jgi:hypothetical protein
MAKLFDQQQLSAGVQEFEEHLQRVRPRDWTVDCQLAKPQNDPPPPPPPRREGVRKAVARYAKGAAPAKGKAQPAALSMETLQSRRLILALAAFVLVTFAGAMSLALTDGAAPTAEEDVSAVESDAPSAAPPASQATQAKTPPAVSASASAPSETYVATIRPDGSLAPDTTPHATVATPPAAVPAPSPDAISDIIMSGEQSEPAPSVPADANAPGENPAAAKPAKKRTVAHAANLASVNPAAAEGDPAASAANPGDSSHPPAAAPAKPVAPKAAAAKTAGAKPVAPKSRAASVAAAKKTDDALQHTPDGDDGGGIFEGANQAVGSLTGAVKKLVGAD